MFLPSVLLRFGLIYLVLLAVSTNVAHVLGIGNSPVARAAVLLVAAMLASLEFAKRNGRFFKVMEKRTVVLGMVLVDLAVQVGSSALAFRLHGQIAGKAFRMGDFLFFTAAVTLIDVGIIWFSVWLAGRLYARKLVKSGAPAHL